ncbi:hypothetical protein [Kaistia nematophila]|uniref:Uncharacterized protein n=1 Tax=Kaistia nematophila TaxID=2994654 RepID=A0A9X3E265_9HYPH|nr:hypothetical protein [Kaistia nematophila]MCX5569272.1 hypothetical protein [Kaistia nematophila]
MTNRPSSTALAGQSVAKKPIGRVRIPISAVQKTTSATTTIRRIMDGRRWCAVSSFISPDSIDARHHARRARRGHTLEGIDITAALSSTVNKNTEI